MRGDCQLLTVFDKLEFFFFIGVCVFFWNSAAIDRTKLLKKCFIFYFWTQLGCLFVNKLYGRIC